MANFLDETLEKVGKEPTGNIGFTAGAHTVKIGMAEAMKDSKDREIIKVTVIGDNDEEGEAKLWLHTEGGAKMAVTKVLGILVHNVAEDKKTTISEFGKRVFANVKTPIETKEGLLKILNEKLIGKEAYIYAEPQDSYTTTKYVDLWHYDQSKRKPRAEAASVTSTVQHIEGEAVDPAELPDGLFD